MLEKWEKNLIFALMVLLAMVTLVELKVPFYYVFKYLNGLQP